MVGENTERGDLTCFPRGYWAFYCSPWLSVGFSITTSSQGRYLLRRIRMPFMEIPVHLFHQRRGLPGDRERTNARD